jgi:quinohemoprotein ethanol dehydrogenase
LPPALTADQAVIERGKSIFIDRCTACHAYGDVPGGYPNLWNLPLSTHQLFETILIEGVYQNAGMASFRDALSKEDVQAVHAFLVDDATKSRQMKR